MATSLRHFPVIEMETLVATQSLGVRTLTPVSGAGLARPGPACQRPAPRGPRLPRGGEAGPGSPTARAPGAGTLTGSSSHGIPSPLPGALGLVWFPAGSPGAGEGSNGCRDRPVAGSQDPGPAGRRRARPPGSGSRTGVSARPGSERAQSRRAPSCPQQPSAPRRGGLGRQTRGHHPELEATTGPSEVVRVVWGQTAAQST